VATVEGWRSPRNRSSGSSGGAIAGLRATAPIKNICCEKIRGCSYREATRLTAPCSRCNISLVPSTGRNFALRSPTRSVQVCKRSGRGHSVSNQFREARRGPQSANALRDIFLISLQGIWGCRDAKR
jgi:hypothetical protein